MSQLDRPPVPLRRAGFAVTARPPGDGRTGRLLGHALALVAVGALVLTGALFPSQAPPAAPAAAAPPASVSGLGGGEQPGDALPPLPAWLQPSDATAEQTVATAGARTTLPDWVRSLEEAPLWSGPDEQAILFNHVPASSYLKPMGPVLGGRLLVYYAGDGESRAAGQAWVDAQTVEPTVAPAWAAAGALAGASEPTLALKPLAKPPVRVRKGDPPAVTARYIAIVDDASGELLYGEGEHTRVAPASTTKIMTTLVGIERGGDLSKIVDVTINGARMNATDGSSVMWLEPGERVSLKTLLYGMMLPSGNDAAEQIALALGGTRERFMGWMNERAQALGLRDTRFVNPSGMDAPGHYSSAHDMAHLARHAMRDETFRKMAAAGSYAADGYNLRNANRLIGWYDGADGVKIGFTDEARKTIVASAVGENGRRVYISLMRSEDLWSDSIALFEWVWKSFDF